MPEKNKRKKKGRRVPRPLLFVCAAFGLAAVAGGAALLPGCSAALLIAGGAALLLPLTQLKRRSARRVKPMIAAGVALLALAAVCRVVTAGVGWRVVPLSARSVDLRGRGLTDTGELARLRGLREADLSDNRLSDVSALSALTGLQYLDLTGNPVEPAQYAALRAALPDCLILCDTPDSVTTALSLGGHALPSLETLERVFRSHSALRAVDCRGAALTREEIDRLRARFPQISFVTTVQIDGQAVDSDAESLILASDAYEEIAAQLAQLPALRRATLSRCVLTPAQYLALRGRFPDLSLNCQLSLCGQVFPAAAAELDLSGCAVDAVLPDELAAFERLSAVRLPDDAPALAQAVCAALPGVRVSYVYRGAVVDAATTELDLRGRPLPGVDELRALIGSAPALTAIRIDTPDAQTREGLAGLSGDVLFLFDIELLGDTYATDVEKIDFGARDIRDRDVPELMAAIALMPRLTEVDMYSSSMSLSNKYLLFDTYPDVFFGWTLRLLGQYKIRTDITAFSTLKNHREPFYTEDDLAPLRLCKNLLALDLGHNHISDISFLTNYPHLRVLILADNLIEDISPLAELTELEYIELFLNDVEDFSPLANHERLLDLNICYNLTKTRRYAGDIAPLLTLTNLERLWFSHNNLTEEQMQALRDGLPNCEFNFEVDESVEGGWRKHDRYYVIYDIFHTNTYKPFS